MKRKKFSRVIFLFLLLCLLYVFRAPLLLKMADFLVVRDPLVKSDVIVVLGGDDNGERVAQGVKLYRQKYAPYLLMASGPLAWRLSGAEWMKKQALFLGVPAKAIILEEKSRSTLENARGSLPLVKKINARQVILVTSPTHSRRSKKVFESVYKQAGIKVSAFPVENSQFKKEGWWQRHEDTQQVIWEYVSLIYYWLRRY